jgi:hypothetical protein
MRKRVVSVASFIFLLAALNVAYSPDFNSYTSLNKSFPENKSLFTDKKDYILGQPVWIFVNVNVENGSIFIQSPDTTYNFLGELKSPIEFFPGRIGEYTVLLKEMNGHILLSENFAVKESNLPSETAASISTDKKAYQLGDFVIIYVNFSMTDSSRLYITYSDII